MAKKPNIDPVCMLHGKKWSEHELGFCLYCCLCFVTLTSDECNVLENGKKEDVCKPCAAKEKKQIKENQNDS